MLVTQKCHYALKAVFALAQKLNEPQPVKIAQIAEEQDIPARFLEVILSQLKQGGFVESRRGNEGGYRLAMRPHDISVGNIVRFVDGPNLLAENHGPLADSEDIFNQVWRQASHSMFEMLDKISITDLIEMERNRRTKFEPNFVI